MQGPLPSPLVTITPHPGYCLPTPNTRVAQSTENMNMWTWTDINCPCQSLFHLEPPSPVQPQLDLRVGTFPTVPRQAALAREQKELWAWFASVFLPLLKSGHSAGALAPHAGPPLSFLHLLMHPHCCSHKEHSLGT